MRLYKIALISILLIQITGCKKQTCNNASGICLFSEDLTPELVQQKLVGRWSGNGAASFSGGMAWEATFKIEPNGHYTGEVTSVQSGTIRSVFNNGDDNLDHPEKKFIIQSIDAFGKANGKVTFVHSGGNLIEYEVKDLVFSNRGEDLDFTIAWGAEINYSLKRH